MFFVVLAYVLAALLVLLALVLFCRAAVRISYAKELYIYACFGFIKFKLYPKAEKEKKKKKHKAASKKKTSAEKSQIQVETHSEKQNYSEASEKKSENIGKTANFIADIIKKVLQFLGKRAKIEVNSLELVVSKKEAADTAVQFGLACGAVSTVLALCSEFGSYKINHDKVRVVPDFVTGKSSIGVDITLSSRVIWILECGVKILYNKIISSERTAK